MKCFNKELISEICKNCFYKNESGYTTFMFPRQLVNSCGWDKAEYDYYAEKLYYGQIEDPNEKEVFMIIYKKVQEILAELEIRGCFISNKTGKPIYNPAMCKIIIEEWDVIGTTKKFNKNKIVNKANEIKKQSENVNSSPIQFGNE